MCMPASVGCRYPVLIGFGVWVYGGALANNLVLFLSAQFERHTYKAYILYIYIYIYIYIYKAYIVRKTYT